MKKRTVDSGGQGEERGGDDYKMDGSCFLKILLFLDIYIQYIFTYI